MFITKKSAQMRLMVMVPVLVRMIAHCPASASYDWPAGHATRFINDKMYGLPIILSLYMLETGLLRRDGSLVSYPVKTTRFWRLVVLGLLPVPPVKLWPEHPLEEPTLASPSLLVITTFPLKLLLQPPLLCWCLCPSC